ncbi:3-mercaptopyruvate sulfurtransferase [Cladochytrium replicatum]|nr:3-mercaptopyruvate sulfurtransferase [Cladochytrium replicatum]
MSSSAWDPSSPIVSTDWLAANLSKVRVLDATWHMPIGATMPKDPPGRITKMLTDALGRGPIEEESKDDPWRYVDGQWKKIDNQPDAEKEFLEKRIPGARYFDIDKIADTTSQLPHMLPTAGEFERHMSRIGVSEVEHVVVYDSKGIFSAPRAWWTFKVFGHDKVSVLDGGLKKWVSESKSVESGPVPSFEPTAYKANFNPDMVIDYQNLLVDATDFLYAEKSVILDARPRPRFLGEAPEPRIEVPSGHIPSAINIPFAEVLNPETGTLLPPDELRKLFDEKRVDMRRPIVAMCGSGVTACIVALALERSGRKVESIKVYDGSWTEWAGYKKGPITSLS